MVESKLGKILLEKGLVTESALTQAIARQKETGKMLGEVLSELGFVSPDDLARALADQLGVPYFELGDDFRLEKAEVKLVPETVARRYCLIPVKKEAGLVITLVMKDPLDVEAIDTVRSLTRMEIRKAISSEARIRATIDKFYRQEAHLERDLKDIAELPPEVVTGDDLETRGNDDQLMVNANDAPVVKFVNLLLMQAVRDRASDIHFEPGEKDVTVRIRVDGLLREITPPPKALYQAIATRIKILSNMDIAERRLPLDGRFKFKVHDRIIDVRVSSLPEAHGEKLVLRVLDRMALIVDMKDIGLDEVMLKRFQKILQSPNGIILVTGPTGSGKTTTLYAALNYLKDPAWNIQTVEDPIEYLIPGINQMQIKPKIGLDFAGALRAILRQDPDMIMIGEIRDLETAQIAMRSSLTGHLVLSTLHTNDAPSALWRMKDIGIEPYLIASTMKLVISQRLVRVICPHCKKAIQPHEESLAYATSILPEASSWTFYHGAGCQKCLNTGYRGRTTIFEYLEVTDPIKEMVIAGSNSVALRRKAMELGMAPLAVNGLRKVQNGTTTIEEVMSVCSGD
ncbi:MAG: ATPase, T2SS/T4P/T4SS family [bacterium]